MTSTRPVPETSVPTPAGRGPGLRIDVLGPLRVEDGDRPIEVRGTTRRAALAVLAANVNATVTEEQLVERLWGDEDPVHSRSILRTAVADLRRVLGAREGAPPGGVVLLAEEATYRLSAPVTAVDLLQARALGRDGRLALREQRPREAADLLGAAVALWRGPALDDVVPPGRTWPEQAELREEHLLLVEDRLTADLASGRAAELLDELAELVGREPLRERLHALRMRALARLGRTADALRAYEEAATGLAEGWGLDPGPQLRAEREAVLAGPASGGSARRALVGTPVDGEASTVMFWFSGLPAEFADPERLAGLLDEIGHRADPAVTGLGGRLVPLQGPTLSAVFHRDDHPHRAVRAAMAVRRAVGAALTGMAAGTIRVRGAVASGEVRVNGGDAGAAGLVLAGRTFESCHRMLQVAAPGRILVDEAVRAATVGAFTFEAVPALAGAYEVTGPHPTVEPCRPQLPRSA